MGKRVLKFGGWCMVPRNPVECRPPARRKLIDDFLEALKDFKSDDMGYLYHKLLDVRNFCGDLEGVHRFLGGKGLIHGCCDKHRRKWRRSRR